MTTRPGVRMRGRMIETRRLGNHTEDSASYIRTAKNSNDETRAIRQNAGHLDERLRNSFGWTGSSSLGRTGLCGSEVGCDTIRVGVVGCGLFATPNSLKSHKRQKELSPLVQLSCITPSCACLRGQLRSGGKGS